MHGKRPKSRAPRVPRPSGERQCRPWRNRPVPRTTGNWSAGRRARTRRLSRSSSGATSTASLRWPAGSCGSREDVEDIAQQVFVKAYFSLKRFDQRAAFSTWLYKITVNECWDLLRKKKVRPLVYESDLSEEQARQVSPLGRKGSGGPDISDRLRSAASALQRLLEGLDERDRAMLILKEVEGFAVEEIAEDIGSECEHGEGTAVPGAEAHVNKVRKRGEVTAASDLTRWRDV